MPDRHDIGRSKPTKGVQILKFARRWGQRRGPGQTRTGVVTLLRGFLKAVLRQLVYVAAGLALTFSLLPPIADAAVGMFKQQDGCRVWRIVDGDTVKMTCPHKGWVSGRLLGMDTPETKAQCVREFLAARTAAYALRLEFWGAGRVQIETEGRDRYDRVLARMYLDGFDVADRMIRNGYARKYDGGRRGSWCL